MPDIAPFRGLRFDPKTVAPSAAIAPPYDVIDPAMHARLLAHDPHNVVRWTLGDDPAKPYGTEAEYRPRAAVVKDWARRGVLIRDPLPAFYAYEMTFTPPEGGKSHYRGILCAVETAKWEEKRILPHEEIRPKVVDDRLNLLRATRVNMGVVQLTIDDREDRMAQIVREAPRRALFEGDDFLGQRHRLEAIEDTASIERLEKLIGPMKAVVADGHHRYTTAIRYREETKSVGSDRTLVMIGNLFQPGLQIYATHRVLVTENADSARALSAYLRDQLTDRDGDVWTIETHHGGSTTVRTSPALENDTLYRRLQRALADRPAVTVETYHDERAAEESLEAHGAAALLCRMPAVGKDEFWERTARGEIFPPKTTFFLPKIFTGIVARSLDDELV